MKPLRPVTLAVAVVLTAGTLTGCGAIADRVGDAVAEKAIEGAIGADVEVDEGNEQVTITGDDGSMTMGARLPADWPGSVPLPSGHEVASAIDLSSEAEGRSLSLVLTVPGREFAEVAAELESAFASSSWTAKDEPTTTQIAEQMEAWMQQFTDGDQSLHVQVQRMDTELSVLYHLTTESQG